jgi:hypothetical protein
MMLTLSTTFKRIGDAVVSLFGLSKVDRWFEPHLRQTNLKDCQIDMCCFSIKQEALYETSFSEIRQKTCISVVFLCAACLPASLIIHIPISEINAQWHFSMSLNSQRFLQFHPTVILVAYVNSCFIIIRQSFLFVSFSSYILTFNAKKKPFKNNHQNQRHLNESVMQWLVCLI